MEYEINKRIRILADEKSSSKASFADQADISLSALYVIFKEGARPSYDMLRKISDAFPDVSMEWLMRGKGPMLLQETVSDWTCWELLKKEEAQHNQLKDDYAAAKDIIRQVRSRVAKMDLENPNRHLASLPGMGEIEPLSESI